MNHKINQKKLNRTSSHRRAMLANMANSLITHEQIKTTLPKAKTLRPYIEKLVTKARLGTLAARRKILAHLNDRKIADKLLSILSERYKNRQGGYTRIVKAGFRYGDMTPMAYLEFVDRDINAKGVELKDVKKEKIDLIK